MKLKHLEAALLDCGFDIDEDTVAMRALAAASRDVEEVLAPREASPDLAESIGVLNHGIDRHRGADGKACSCGGCACMQRAIQLIRSARDSASEAYQRGRRQAFEMARVEFVKAGPGKFSDWLEVQRDACTPANRDEGESNGQG